MFWGVFCLFYRDFRGSQGQKILDVFEGFPWFFFFKTKEKKDRVQSVCKCLLTETLFLQKFPNHYEIQQMAFCCGKIRGFPTLGVADICRKACDLRSKTEIPIPGVEKIIAESCSSLFV